MVSQKRIAAFQEKVLEYYVANGRILPWRKNISPYRILVSEIMLQQTQASRVAPKFIEFIKSFANVKSLAQASLRDVLEVWSGLGYNRRAKFLHQAAQVVSSQKTFPKTVEELQALPGIGYATAAAIMAYAYNKPVVYIETNIRSVFLHEFFKSKENISDTQLLPLIALSLQGQEPRIWYSALMDYGANLKIEVGNPSKRSKHHVTQAKFAGSVRQVRGKIIKRLLQGNATRAVLLKEINDNRTAQVLGQLCNEGMVQKQGQKFLIE